MIDIVSRAEWGARRPSKIIKGRRVPVAPIAMRVPSPELWLHHTAAEQHGAGGVRQTQDYHMDAKNWTDIAYSFLVDDNGIVYEGRGAGVVGGHTVGHNSKSHALCLMGNFEKRPLPAAMIEATSELLAHGHAKGWWGDHFTGGHRQASGASTACPGRYGMAALPLINRPVPTPVPEPVEDEMTPEQTKEVLDLLRNMHHQIVVPGVGLQSVDSKVDAIIERLDALEAEVQGLQTEN